MTIEHVSVPRDELEEIARELSKYEAREVAYYARHFGEELQAILSRATPSDGSFASDLVNEGLDYFYKSGDDGDKEYVRAIRAHIAALEKTSAPRVVAGDLVQQLRGRAEFLRDMGQIKSPQLMEQAVNVIESFDTSLPHAAVPDGFIVIPMPNPEEMEALRSFAATAGDDESYTVSRELMSRLLLFGAVYRSTKRDWYYLTDFGRCLLAAAPQAGDRG